MKVRKAALSGIAVLTLIAGSGCNHGKQQHSGNTFTHTPPPIARTRTVTPSGNPFDHSTGPTTKVPTAVLTTTPLERLGDSGHRVAGTAG